MKPGRFVFVLIVLITVLSEDTAIGGLSMTENIKAGGEGASVTLGLSDVGKPKQPPATQFYSTHTHTKSSNLNSAATGVSADPFAFRLPNPDASFSSPNTLAKASEAPAGNDTNESLEQQPFNGSPTARHHTRSWLSELLSGFFPTLGVVVCFFAVCRCRAERQRRQMMLEAQQPVIVVQQMAFSETTLQAQINFHRQEARRIEQQLQLQPRPYIYAFGQPGQTAEASMNPGNGPSVMSAN